MGDAAGMFSILENLIRRALFRDIDAHIFSSPVHMQ